MTKKRCPSLQIHEYAAITQAGISPPNEIQSKWNTRPRECENSSTKNRDWCDVLWFGLSAFYHHTRVSLWQRSHSVEHWPLHFSNWYFQMHDMSQRRWDDGREREMNMRWQCQPEKKIILLGCFPSIKDKIYADSRRKTIPKTICHIG